MKLTYCDKGRSLLAWGQEEKKWLSVNVLKETFVGDGAVLILILEGDTSFKAHSIENFKGCSLFSIQYTLIKLIKTKAKNESSMYIFNDCKNTEIFLLLVLVNSGFQGIPYFI